MTRCFIIPLALTLACGTPRTPDSEPPAPPSEPEQEEPPPVAGPSEPATVLPPLEASEEELAALASANQFGFDLYAQLRSAEGNLVFSPASVQMALSMTYAGARGETADEMRRALRIEGEDEAHHRALGVALRTWSSTDSATLRVANRLYAQESAPLEQPFVTLTRDVYGAPIQRVNFAEEAEAVRVEINRWVAAQTEDRIRDLLASLEPLTRMVLVNAVYFRGTWQTQFQAHRTVPRTFHVGGSEAASVPSMRTTSRFAWARLPSHRVLEMPYAGGELSMVWLLPEARDGLAALEAELSSDALARWRAATREVEVEVQIPRFRLEPASSELKTALEAMGMRRSFHPRDADFRDIADLSDGLYISAVVHKAFIEVNEEGTEAAAATAVVMATEGAAPPPRDEPPRFIAEHPFLFALLDRRTGLVLFLGRVVDPR